MKKIKFLQEARQEMEGKMLPIPNELVKRFARIMIEEGRAWLDSEEGKKEVLRIKTNRLHREEYARKKAGA